MLVEHHDERTGSDVLGPGVVPVLAGTPGSVRRAGAPIAGYDNSAVYGEVLGLTESERDDLRERGVI
jgi:formyl-CoA transferase